MSTGSDQLLLGDFRGGETLRRVFGEESEPEARNGAEDHPQQDVQRLFRLDRLRGDGRRLDHADVGHLLPVHVLRDAGLLEPLQVVAVILLVGGDFPLQRLELVVQQVERPDLVLQVCHLLRQGGRLGDLGAQFRLGLDRFLFDLLGDGIPRSHLAADLRFLLLQERLDELDLFAGVQDEAVALLVILQEILLLELEGEEPRPRFDDDLVPLREGVNGFVLRPGLLLAFEGCEFLLQLVDLVLCVFQGGVQLHPLLQEQAPLLFQGEDPVLLLVRLHPALRLLELLFVFRELLFEEGRLGVAEDLEVFLLEVVDQEVHGPGGHLRVLVLEGHLDDVRFLDPLHGELLLEGENGRLEGGHVGGWVLGQVRIDGLDLHGGEDLFDQLPARQDLDLGVDHLFLVEGHQEGLGAADLRPVHVLPAELDHQGRLGFVGGREQERPDGDGEHRGKKNHPHLGPVLEQDREEVPQAPRRRLLLVLDVSLHTGSRRVHYHLPHRIISPG